MYLSTIDRFIQNVWVYVICAYYIPGKHIPNTIGGFKVLIPYAVYIAQIQTKQKQ